MDKSNDNVVLDILIAVGIIVVATMIWNKCYDGEQPKVPTLANDIPQQQIIEVDLLDEEPCVFPEGMVKQYSGSPEGIGTFPGGNPTV